MILIGIDPGLDGAIAFLRPAPFGSEDADQVAVHDLPTVPLEGGGTVTRRVHGPALASMVRANCAKGEPILVFLEDISAGGRDSSAQTVGSQYRTRGTIECVIEMLGLQFTAVSPQRWKGLYGFGKDKKDALAIARELYPALEGDALRLAKHHNRAEAMLIARWGLKVKA